MVGVALGVIFQGPITKQGSYLTTVTQVSLKNLKMGEMGKKLFNLSAIIITSLYRVITLMTLRHCYVIMSHIQGVSYYTTFFHQNTIFLKIINR